MEAFNNMDEYFMGLAFTQAKLALAENEVPVGAVVVSNRRIIGKGYNQTEQLKDATAHAEMIAITSASAFLGTRYLSDCTLYVTLEPCVMCAGALYWAQIGRVVYAASDKKRGFSTVKPSILHPKTQLTSGIMESLSEVMLQAFFQKMREK